MRAPQMMFGIVQMRGEWFVSDVVELCRLELGDVHFGVMDSARRPEMKAVVDNKA